MDPATASLLLKIASSLKEVYSLYDNMNALLERRGKKQLAIAINYLRDPHASVGLIRQGLALMETAFTLLDEKPILKADKRKRQRNELCYYIAKFHYELGDPYESTTRYWASFIDLKTSLPEGFKQLLKNEDWTELYNRQLSTINVNDDSDNEILLDYLNWRNRYD